MDSNRKFDFFCAFTPLFAGMDENRRNNLPLMSEICLLHECVQTPRHQYCEEYPICLL